MTPLLPLLLPFSLVYQIQISPATTLSQSLLTRPFSWHLPRTVDYIKKKRNMWQLCRTHSCVCVCASRALLACVSDERTDEWTKGEWTGVGTGEYCTVCVCVCVAPPCPHIYWSGSNMSVKRRKCCRKKEAEKAETTPLGISPRSLLLLLLLAAVQ